MARDVTFRDIEIRTWPERSDLVVIDVAGAVVLAQYLQFEPGDPFARSGDLFDPAAPYDRRCRAAIAAIENDQEFLQRHFDTEEAVCLRIDRSGRERLEVLLGEYGLRLRDTDLRALPATAKTLREMDLQRLYHLLCDWHDMVDRRYPAGSSQTDPESWVHRARPGGCLHFHYLSGDQGEDSAWELFCDLIDVPLRDFSFGMLLRYVYFLRAEFPERESFPLKAFADAGIES